MTMQTPSAFFVCVFCVHVYCVYVCVWGMGRDKSCMQSDACEYISQVGDLKKLLASSYGQFRYSIKLLILLTINFLYQLECFGLQVTELFNYSALNSNDTDIFCSTICVELMCNVRLCFIY